MLNNIAFLTAKLIYSVLSSLPDRVLRFLLAGCRKITEILLPSQLFQNARHNLKMCFPEKNNEEIKSIAKNHIGSLYQFAFDFIKSLNSTKDYMLDKLEFENLAVLDEAFQTTPFVVCLGGHLLNYEMLISLPLVRPEYAWCNIYQSTDTKDLFEKWICKTRCRHDAFAIPSTSAYKFFLNLKDSVLKGEQTPFKGFVVGVLGDTSPGENSKLSVPFLHRQMAVYTGAERIGRKLNAAFVFANINHKGNGQYLVRLSKLDPPQDSPFPYTTMYFDLLESNIKSQPENWLLWNTNRFST
jgi:Kdo2-lipid IVA lauroyltransferase/acyltransferase